jgi:hypothetical protein
MTIDDEQHEQTQMSKLKLKRRRLSCSSSSDGESSAKASFENAYKIESSNLSSTKSDIRDVESLSDPSYVPNSENHTEWCVTQPPMPKYLESDRIHATGLIVDEYWNAIKPLSQWPHMVFEVQDLAVTKVSLD